MKGFIRYISVLILLVLFGCSSSSSGGAAGNASLSSTLSTSSVVAGGSVSATAKLTAVTTFPVNNINITFTSNRPDLIHFATSTATNFGSGSITVKSNTSGSGYVVLNIDNSVAIPAGGVSVAVTATAEGLTSTQTLLVTALAGGGSPVPGTTNISLALDKTSILDNGGQAVATATVTDSAGTPLSGQAVTFVFSPVTGPATVVPINAGVTDINGKAYATVTGTTTATAQNIFIYASVGTISTAQPLTVTPSSVVAPSSIPRNIALSLVKAQLTSSEQTILTATVTDSSNLPVSNQTVAFSLLPVATNAAYTPINGGLTDSSGKAYAVITGGVAASIQNAVVYASVGVAPNTVTGSTTIQILPPGASSASLPASKVTITSDKASLTSVNTDALITASVTDSAGAVVSGTGVTFTVVSGPITIVTPAGATNTGSDGKALAVVRATATTNPTYALINATTTNGTSQTFAIIIAATGKPKLTLSIAKPIIEATDQEVLATVTVLDSADLPVNGQSVTFANVSGPFTVAPLTVTTGIDGKATTKLTPTAAAFTSNLLLSVSLTYQGTPYTLVATAVVNPAVNLSVALDTATVDTVGQIIATATATTASGTPLPGQVVTYTLTGPATPVGQSATTASDGTSKLVFTHNATTNIGNVIVEAAITYGGTTYRAYATAVPKVANVKLDLFVQSGFTPTYSISGPLGNLTDSTTTTVDGLTAGLPIKAKFSYLDGTPIPNQTITFTALDGGLTWNSAVGPLTTTATTTTSGEAYAVAVPGTFPAPGFVHIEASTTVNGVIYRQVMPITVQATQVQKTFTLDKAAVVIAPNSSAVVSGTFNLKNSNIPVSGSNVTFSIVSGSATITSPATVPTDGSGNATVIISASPVTIKETVYVNAAVVINGVTFNTISSFTVDPSVKILLATDLAKVGAVGGQVVVTATLTDSSNAPIPGQAVTFDFPVAGQAAFVSPAATTTGADGTAVVTLQTTATDSTQNVLVRATAIVGAITYTKVTTFQITKGIGTLVVTSPATTSSSAKAPAAGVGWLTSVKVTLLDANGNPRTNVPITLSVAASDRPGYGIYPDATGVPVVSHTVNTDSQGVATFSTQSATVSVGVAGDFDSTQVVWRAETNDAVPIIGYSASTYNLTGI